MLTDSPDSITGTSGDDTINAANGTEDTLSITDVISGGAGTDKLSLVLDTGGTLPAASITAVEILQVRDAVGATIDLNNIESLTTVVLNGGTSNTELDNVDTTITSIKMDTVKGDLKVDTGTVTTLNLTLANVKGDATTGDDVDVDITEGTTAIDKLNITVESASRLEVLNADEVKTATVAATGSLTVDDWNEAAALETLIVSGSGNVTFSDLSDAAALESVSSTNTGTLNLDYGTALATTVQSVAVTGAGAVKVTSGATSTAITGGDGNDVVGVADLDYGAAGVQKIAGGAGTDTINVTASANLDAGFIANVTGFEVLDIAGSNGTDGGGTGNGDYNVDGLGFTTVVADGDLTKAATVSGITTEDIRITETLTAALALNLKTATGSTDSLKVTITGDFEAADAATTTTTDDAHDITVAELDTDNANVIETLTIDSSTAAENVAGTTNTITVLDTDATKLVVVGDHALTITDFALAAAVNTTIKTIDASDSTGGLIMSDGISTAAVSLIGSDVTDDLFVDDTVGDGSGTGTGSTINAGKGGDVITISVTGAADTLIIEKGDSLAGFTDTDASSLYTAAGDRETFDIVTGFTSGEDTIDLGVFGFTGQKASALAAVTLTEANALKLVNGTTTSINDLFIDTGVQRGVAVASGGDYSDIGGSGTNDVIVFIDSNGDGDFNVAADEMIVLSGVTSVALADFGF